MGAFRDLDEFLVVEPIELPIKGKVYSFPGEISARAWLLLQPVDLDEEVVDDEYEVKLRQEILGGVEQEMVEDGLSSAHIKAVFYTLIAWHLSGQETALEVWNKQGKAPAPNRAARRASRTKSVRQRGSQDGSKGQTTRQAPEE